MYAAVCGLMAGEAVCVCVCGWVWVWVCVLVIIGEREVAATLNQKRFSLCVEYRVAIEVKSEVPTLQKLQSSLKQAVGHTPHTKTAEVARKKRECDAWMDGSPFLVISVTYEKKELGSRGCVRHRPRWTSGK